MPYFKLIQTGHILEVYQYEKEPIIPDNSDHGDSDDFPYHDINATDEKAWIYETEGKQTKEEYGKKNANVRRNIVRRQLNANFSKNSKFITLTFKDHVTDLDVSNKQFKEFIQRLRSRYGDFKYLAVIEFTKIGRVHYHMVSDLPYIQKGLLYAIWQNRPISRNKNSKFYCVGSVKKVFDRDRYEEQKEYWRQTGKGARPVRSMFETSTLDDTPKSNGGWVKINKISHVDNVGAYIVKYMTKESDNPKLEGRKTYLSSHNLVKEQIIRGDTAEALIEHFGLNEKIPVYTNSYQTEYLGAAQYREYNLVRKSQT